VLVVLAEHLQAKTNKLACVFSKTCFVMLSVWLVTLAGCGSMAGWLAGWLSDVVV
jgi:hypothetical protein